MSSIQFPSFQYGYSQQYTSVTMGSAFCGLGVGGGANVGQQAFAANFQMFDVWSALLQSGGTASVTQPFFGGFLEGQQPGQSPVQTMAYPSDSDHDQGAHHPHHPHHPHCPGGGQFQTMRYPSDSDSDVGINPPGGGQFQTMRYPSDSDGGSQIHLA